MSDLDWLAGFVEGEGSFGYHSQTLRASASQKERWPLQRLVNRFGGRIYGPSRAGVHLWAISGESARAVMLELRPLLSPRRQEQIDRAIAARGEPKHNRDKTHCAQGHRYAGRNVRYSKQKNGRTRRTCRTCHAESSRARRRRAREGA